MSEPRPITGGGEDVLDDGRALDLLVGEGGGLAKERRERAIERPVVPMSERDIEVGRRRRLRRCMGERWLVRKRRGRIEAPGRRRRGVREDDERRGHIVLARQTRR
jgi:hypothetical protein